MFLVNGDVIYYVERSNETNAVILILVFLLISVYFLPHLFDLGWGQASLFRGLRVEEVYLSETMLANGWSWPLC